MASLRQVPVSKNKGFLKLVVALLLLTICVAFGGAAGAGNVKVWVNTNTGVYHCPGGQYYGNTKQGEYLAEDQALAQGNRPAYGQHCSSSAANSSSTTARGLMSSPAAPAGAKVWVNTTSNVYHCPGTRYYGATKKGRYMSESEAIAQGNRPAYGARC
jgi:hypothetical protein